MPDIPDIPDIDWSKIPLGPFDTRLWWLLIAIAITLLLTVQAIETAVEGAWPHQRRPGNFLPRARAVQTSWAFVAVLVVPGALLAIANVAVLIWKDPPRPEGLALGGTLLAIGWVLFLLFSLDVLNLGKLMGNLGIIGPLTLMVLLVVADILLYVAFRDIVPAWENVREAAEGQIRDWLPFLD
jgi:tryptophan-rich sensory protein